VKVVAVATVVAALAPGAALAAQPMQQLLELPGEVLPTVPPLAPPQPPLRPGADVEPLRGTAAAIQRVDVAIAGDGSPTAITATQRLELTSVGDYVLFVPAPATAVAATAESASQPGLRPNQIVWRGFARGRRTLAAVAELRVRDSAFALPARIRIEGVPAAAGPFELVVTVENASAVTVRTADGAAEAGDLVSALRRLRAAARARTSAAAAIPLRGPGSETSRQVAAAFRVSGSVTFPPGAARIRGATTFSGTIRRERRLVRFAIRGTAARAVAPRLRLLVGPTPAAAVPQAAGADAVVNGYLDYARTMQYHEFLANPDPNGRSRTTYVFETETERPAATPAPEEDGEDEALPLPILALGGVLLVGGLVVLWAHL
jgi:hypothetical protein